MVHWSNAITALVLDQNNMSICLSTEQRVSLARAADTLSKSFSS